MSFKLSSESYKYGTKSFSFTDYPLECTLSNNGYEYKGTQNKSKSGIDCGSWDHLGIVHSEWSFVDGDAESAGKYCRNPDGQPEGPWCRFPSRHNPLAMEHCDIPSCGKIELHNLSCVWLHMIDMRHIIHSHSHQSVHSIES